MASSLQKLMCSPVKDVQLLWGSSAETVDEESQVASCSRSQVVEDAVDDLVDDLVGGKERTTSNARLAMDPHADLHLALWEFEVGVPDGGQDTRRNGDTDAARSLQRVASRRSHRLQVCSRRSARTSDLVTKEDASYASSLGSTLGRCRSDIVGRPHLPNRDSFGRGEVGGKVEVEAITSVVAVQVENATTAVDRASDCQHLIGAGRREQVPDSTAIDEPTTNISNEKRQVSRPSSSGDRHSSAEVVAGRDQATRLTLKDTDPGGVCQSQSFQCLVDEPLRCIQQFPHDVSETIAASSPRHSVPEQRLEASSPRSHDLATFHLMKLYFAQQSVPCSWWSVKVRKGANAMAGQPSLKARGIGVAGVSRAGGNALSTQDLEPEPPSSRGDKKVAPSGAGNLLDLVETLAGFEVIGLTPLARRVGISVPTVYRMLRVLKEKGYVEQLRTTKEYRLTLKLFEIGCGVASKTTIRDMAVVDIARLAEKTGMTTNLGVLVNGSVLYLSKVESGDLLTLNRPPGSRAPATCTAMGKAMLAFDTRPVESIVGKGPYECPTGHSIRALDALKKDLAEIRRTGYSVDRQETAIGLWSVGAPITGTPDGQQGAISVAAFRPNMDEDECSRLGEIVLEFADRISGRIGDLGYLANRSWFQ